MSTETDFETELNAEVTKRLDMMEEPDYAFPDRMRKSDFVIAGVLAAACLVVAEIATFTAGVV